jgi:arylsulfatase A-like enzyme
LLPTFLDLAGGAAPAGLDGKSFAAVLRGETPSHRDRIFTTHSGDGQFNVYPIRSVRTHEWKYLRNLRPDAQHHSHISRAAEKDGYGYWQSWLAAAKSDPRAAAKVQRHIERPAEELYDLTADPFEQHNLAASPEHATRLATLRAELDAWMREQGDTRSTFGTPTLLGEPAPPIPSSRAK